MASKKPSAKMDIKGLKVIQTALTKMTDGHYVVQVGIFGSKAARKGDSEMKGMTNAEIGLIHEMGSRSRNIPRRSFLWDTFKDHGKDLLPVLKKDCEELFKSGKVDEYLKRVGIAAVNLVQEAFETSGWGSWAPNSYSTLMGKLKGSLYRRKQMAAEVMFEGATHAKPLIRSGQLWQAIAARTAKA